jgi:hypothetical protein
VAQRDLAMDPATTDIRAVDFTPSRDGDSPVPPDLLGQIPADEQVGTVTADRALLRKGRMRDSSRDSSVVAGLHEQTHPAELQDQELAGLQRSAEAARLPDDLVRSGDGLGAATDRQARPAAAIWRCRDPDLPDDEG